MISKSDIDRLLMVKKIIHDVLEAYNVDPLEELIHTRNALNLLDEIIPDE